MNDTNNVTKIVTPPNYTPLKPITVGEIPQVYMDSLTYAEQILELIKYIRDVVFPTLKTIIDTTNDNMEIMNNTLEAYLQTLNEMIKDIEEFKTNITNEWNLFKTALENRQDNFENTVNNKLDEYEELYHNFEMSITNQFTAFQNNMRTQFNNLSNEFNNLAFSDSLKIEQMRAYLDEGNNGFINLNNLKGNYQSILNDYLYSIPWNSTTNGVRTAKEQMASSLNPLSGNYWLSYYKDWMLTGTDNVKIAGSFEPNATGIVDGLMTYPNSNINIGRPEKAIPILWQKDNALYWNSIDFDVENGQFVAKLTKTYKIAEITDSELIYTNPDNLNNYHVYNYGETVNYSSYGIIAVRNYGNPTNNSVGSIQFKLNQNPLNNFYMGAIYQSSFGSQLRIQINVYYQYINRILSRMEEIIATGKIDVTADFTPQFNELKSNIQSLQTEISTLQTNVNNDITNLTSAVNTLQTDYTTLNDTVKTNETLLNEAIEQNSLQSGEIETLKTNVNNLSARLVKVSTITEVTLQTLTYNNQNFERTHISISLSNINTNYTNLTLIGGYLQLTDTSGNATGKRYDISSVYTNLASIVVSGAVNQNLTSLPFLYIENYPDNTSDGKIEINASNYFYNNTGSKNGVKVLSYTLFFIDESKM